VTTSADRRLLAATALAVVAAALVALPAHATYGARTTADEPYYLLSALSIAEDASLDIADELAERRYEPFHRIPLDPQTIALDGSGRQVSPHDPLLPLVLAAPMALGGWVAAKATLAVLAGVLAAVTAWLAVTRFAVDQWVAAAVVAGFGTTAPLVSYANQVYPELAAALAVTVGLAAVTASPSMRSAATWVATVIALPWLSVKYAPVAAVLTAAGLASLRPHGRRPLVLAAAVLTAAGVAYLTLHRLWYGGFTVYAAGDHFVDGELLVVGRDPDYLGRTQRLTGLLLDRGFGLAAWNPAWLLLVPALGWFTARGRHRRLLTATLGAGWATATWVALTMHGWWWPGRQVVVVLPVAVVIVAAWLDTARRWLPPAAAALLVGAVSWWWLVVEAGTRRRTLVVDFERTANPWYRTWRHALPDYRAWDGTALALAAVWCLVLGAVAFRAATRGDRPRATQTTTRMRAAANEPTPTR
jgi:hypothetical protein